MLLECKHLGLCLSQTKVYVDFNLRFYWASMQLQNLCSFRIEADL
jgi:hypothetical protein